MPLLSAENIIEVHTKLLSNMETRAGKIIRLDDQVWWDIYEAEHTKMLEESGFGRVNDHGFIAADFFRNIRYLDIYSSSGGLLSAGFYNRPADRIRTVNVIRSYAALTAVAFTVDSR